MRRFMVVVAVLAVLVATSFNTPNPEIPVPEAVDLGLSVKWASFNLGASKPEEYGNYYAWGETEPKEEYSWKTYKWSKGTPKTQTKYCTNPSYGYNGFVDKKYILDPEDDAAHAAFGGTWRMPTGAELDELWTMCSWEFKKWTSASGVCGFKVTGPNGNSIFLPCPGHRRGKRVVDEGRHIFLWSSSLTKDIPSDAWYLYCLESVVSRSYFNRSYGYSIRPVSE